MTDFEDQASYAVEIPEDWYPPRWQTVKRHAESSGRTFRGFRVTCDVHGVMLQKKGFSGYTYCPVCVYGREDA